jgi:hypothetical protein
LPGKEKVTVRSRSLALKPLLAGSKEESGEVFRCSSPSLSSIVKPEPKSFFSTVPEILQPHMSSSV